MKVVMAFDADKHLRKADGTLAKPNVARGEQRLIDAFSPEHDVFSAEWDLRSAKGIDDLLTAGGTPRLVDRYQDPTPKPRVPRPSPEPASVDGGDDLAEVQQETRERIERRFTKEYRTTVAIIAPPPGTAKTGSGLRAQETTGRTVSWAVPRHVLADELVERNATERCACGIARGTCPKHAFAIHHDEGRNPNNCVQFEVIQAPREAGYGSATGALVCGTRDKPICPHYATCGYQGQFDRTGSHVAPIEMVAQRPTSTEGRDVVIVDDVDGSQLLHRVSVTMETLERARSSRTFADVREITGLFADALREAPGKGVYHAEAFELLEHVAWRNGTTLEAVLSGTPPSPGLAPEPTVEGFTTAVPGQLVDLIGQLHQEYAWYRAAAPFTSGIRITAKAIDLSRLMTPVVKADGTTSLTSKAVAILSSPPSPLLRQWTNHLGLEVVKPYQPKVALPPSVRVIQDVGGFYGKGSVALRDLTTLLRRAANYLRETGAENPAVITHKVMREQVASKLGIPQERVLHFGNLRGSNAVRDADVLVVIGTPGMSPEEAYWGTCAAYRGQGSPPSKRMVMRWQAYGGWRDERGRGREIEALTFADQRVAEVYEAARRDELIQAIYRCRPHDRANDPDGRTALIVVLMTAMPVEGLRVDELRFSGNAAKAEEAIERLDETYARLSSGPAHVSSRSFAEAAGTGIERAQEYLRSISAVRSPTCINEVIHVGDEAAETLEPPVPISLACTCVPCAANRGDRCNCGRFWKEPSGRWRCGNHDPKPPDPDASREESVIQGALNGQVAESTWST